jgi:hypothetical protein
MTDIVGKGWPNGGKPAGIKIHSVAVRQSNFDRRWGRVKLILEGYENNPVVVNIDKDSFWDSNCGELISAEIGRWITSIGLFPWPPGHPPAFHLRASAPGVFEVAPMR